MPFQIGSVAIHDDAQHSGSAKREQALGVAGLDASAELTCVNVMTQKYLSIDMVI